MKALVIIMCAVALAASAEPDAAAKAAREKARAELRAHQEAINARIRSRRSTATTTQNSNGTFTVSGPFESDDLPGCKELSLTFKAEIVTNRVTGANRPASGAVQPPKIAEVESTRK